VLPDKKGNELIFTPHHVNFNETCAGLTGVKFILPAGITRPTPAKDALAEL
jgi:hypothetical protein